MDAVAAWAEQGEWIDVGGDRVFVLDRPAGGTEAAEPLLVLHGFPSCSFDWHLVVDQLGHDRRIVLLDFLGFGLSAKPDRPYSLFHQADRVEAAVAHAGVDAVALVTHDMGDSVGGELLARSIDGTLPFSIVRRVLTNGSIYLDQAQLTVGQQVLRSAADERLPEGVINEEGFGAGLALTFGPDTQPSTDELAAQWAFMHRDDGERLLPRIIRYLDERAAHERRWTGAIESHPAPLGVVWGDLDPVAVVAMLDTLRAARPSASFETLEGIGHYPMVEAPDRFAAAVSRALDAGG